MNTKTIIPAMVFGGVSLALSASVSAASNYSTSIGQDKIASSIAAKIAENTKELNFNSKNTSTVNLAYTAQRHGRAGQVNRSGRGAGYVAGGHRYGGYGVGVSGGGVYGTGVSGGVYGPGIYGTGVSGGGIYGGGVSGGAVRGYGAAGHGGYGAAGHRGYGAVGHGAGHHGGAMGRGAGHRGGGHRR